MHHRITLIPWKAKSVSCKLGTGGTADISKAEMQKAIVGPKGTLVDNSASNVRLR